MIPKSETNGGDDMADIAKKITKLDEKIGKLKERIKSDADEKNVSYNSDDDVADKEEVLGQTSFFEKKNPYSD